MNPTIAKSLLTLGVLAASSLLASAADPSADQILRQMSDKLAAAHHFSVDASREIDPQLIEGMDIKVPEKAHVTASVQRPNKVAGRSESKAGARRFVADGHTLFILDEKEGHYAALPMHKTLDGLVDELDEKYGFTPPLAEFLVSNPYKDFHHEAQSVTYAGREKLGGFLGLGGVECHHLSLKGKEADAELWIGVNDQLPQKLVATFHREGNPQVRLVFHTWNLNAPVSASEFTFNPPKDADKIEMWTTAKMQAASKN